MRYLPARSLSVVAVPVLALALFAALLFLEERSQGRGHVRVPVSEFGRPFEFEQMQAVLGIDANGVYYFNRDPIRPVALSAVLDSAFRRLPQGSALYIIADRNLAAGELDVALRIAQAQGIRHVSLVADPPEFR